MDAFPFVDGPHNLAPEGGPRVRRRSHRAQVTAQTRHQIRSCHRAPPTAAAALCLLYTPAASSSSSSSSSSSFAPAAASSCCCSAWRPPLSLTPDVLLPASSRRPRPCRSCHGSCSSSMMSRWSRSRGGGGGGWLGGSLGGAVEELTREARVSHGGSVVPLQTAALRSQEQSLPVRHVRAPRPRLRVELDVNCGVAPAAAANPATAAVAASAVIVADISAEFGGEGARRVQRVGGGG